MMILLSLIPIVVGCFCLTKYANAHCSVLFMNLFS